jgi:hypothetical protein
LLASSVTADPARNEMRPISEPFLQIVDDADIGLGDEQELASSLPTGTYPCIFKVGQSFFDYTPLRLALDAVTGGYGIAVNPTNTTQFVFGICQ